MLAAENISFEPGAVSNAELDKIKISTKSEAVNPAEIPADQHFFVIGGAFRDQKNALKLIGELREQGYPAAIIDTTPGGLYIVSMKGFNSYDEAQQQLDEVKKSGFASSWILKKNRG
jgi:cell division septation protein DedD